MRAIQVLSVSNHFFRFLRSDLATNPLLLLLLILTAWTPLPVLPRPRHIMCYRMFTLLLRLCIPPPFRRLLLNPSFPPRLLIMPPFKRSTPPAQLYTRNPLPSHAPARLPQMPPPHPAFCLIQKPPLPSTLQPLPTLLPWLQRQHHLQCTPSRAWLPHELQLTSTW